MSAAKHIAILCSRLDLPGGIERAVVNTANLFAEKGQQVTLIILDETGNSYYAIGPGIKKIQQPLSFGITHEGNMISRKIRLLSDVLRLRKIFKQVKPDIIISSEYPFSIAAVLTGAKKYAKVYAWEHHHHGWIDMNKFWTLLRNKAYPRLHGIICLNNDEAKYYSEFTRTFVVPNAVKNESSGISDLNSHSILSVGWLIPRKGIDMLLKVATAILKKHPGWTWKIIGDGEMKADVLNCISSEKLEGRLILQQPTGADLSEEYINSSLFILTSRFEAFPMVLLEAQSFGIPCISFDCPSGPADIIIDQVNGLLIEKENVGQMIIAIDELIVDEEKRKELGRNAIRDIDRFSLNSIYKKWSDIF